MFLFAIHQYVIRWKAMRMTNVNEDFSRFASHDDALRDAGVGAAYPEDAGSL